VSTLKDRQRAARRARLEREMMERQEHAQARRKRNLSILGAVAAVAVVIIGVVVAVKAGKSDKKTTASPTASTTTTCTYTPNPSLHGDATNPVDKDLKDTGLPNGEKIPKVGTRDMVMDTNQGKITITLDLAKAPCAANSFAFLAAQKFFDKSTCHRLVPEGIYILQCGDPSGKGDGGPGYTFAHEYLPTNDLPNYPEGVVAMANPNDQDLNGSQFFIIYKDTPTTPDDQGAPQSNLASSYTIIGTVTGGMDVVQKVAAAGAKPADKQGTTAPKLPVNISTVTVSDIK
jgi:peptidyl-prolyl cis-trans isomerase B (cyclophilin B)